jgi:hypothetical protein
MKVSCWHLILLSSTIVKRMVSILCQLRRYKVSIKARQWMETSCNSHGQEVRCIIIPLWLLVRIVYSRNRSGVIIQLMFFQWLSQTVFVHCLELLSKLYTPFIGRISGRIRVTIMNEREIRCWQKMEKMDENG